MKANKIVRCGHVDCLSKPICPHYNEHKQVDDCLSFCIQSDHKHKCYDIIEMRKIKLKRIKTND